MTTTDAATGPAATGTAPSVTAIVATRGRPELARTLAAILDHDYSGALDVIVVFDHCEPDPGLAQEAGPDRRRVQVLVNDRTPRVGGGSQHRVAGGHRRPGGLL